MCKKILIVLLLILFPLAVYGDIFIANGDVNLRADYPKFPFYQNAARIGVVQKDDIVTLLEKKEVFNYEWLKVKHNKSGKVGWVYNGMLDQTPYFEKTGG